MNIDIEIKDGLVDCKIQTPHYSHSFTGIRRADSIELLAIMLKKEKSLRPSSGETPVVSKEQVAVKETVAVKEELPEQEEDIGNTKVQIENYLLSFEKGQSDKTDSFGLELNNFRANISRISKEHNMKFKTKVTDDVILITRVF